MRILVGSFVKSNGRVKTRGKCIKKEMFIKAQNEV